MKPSIIFMLFAAALILSGCGPAALPGAAKRPVADSDVVGRWRYLGDYKKTTIVIEFTPDHKFVQTVTGAGGATKTQHGTWVLDHAYLQLHDVLLNDSVSGFSLPAWNPKESSWWFTDESGHLELYGGEWSYDPDQCWPLERLGVSGASSGSEKSDSKQ
jgi:hypothetical protein